ncbi:MAG: AbrB/MazE/SpoVT family DNA-binding domain-containing protein [Chloroflexota bacterium]
MKMKVNRWGNSLGIRLPKTIAEQLDLQDGAIVDVELRDDEIVIKRRRYTLDDMLEQITPENVHGETDWGTPTGKEQL